MKRGKRGKRDNRAAGPFVPPAPTAEDLAEVAAEVRDMFAWLNANMSLPCNRPQQKSLTSEAPRGTISSMPKPRTGSGRPKEFAPYTLTRQGKGRWRERG